MIIDSLSSALAISPSSIVRNKVLELSLACLLLLGAKQEDGKYKHTVDLPKTTFGLRANSVQREPELQKLWDENQVLKRVSERNTGVSQYLQYIPEI
jgi:isoleucyl-tRNA synthetase